MVLLRRRSSCLSEAVEIGKVRDIDVGARFAEFLSISVDREPPDPPNRGVAPVQSTQPESSIDASDVIEAPNSWALAPEDPRQAADTARANEVPGGEFVV